MQCTPYTNRGSGSGGALVPGAQPGSCVKSRSKGRGQGNVWNKHSTTVVLVLASHSGLFTLVRYLTVCLSMIHTSN